jgi:hypothetical protein
MRRDHAYAYVVAGVNPAGIGPDSAPMTITPDIHTPRAPIIQTAIGRNGRIVLNWLPLWPEAVSYTVKRRAAAGGAFTSVASGITGQTYTDAGLTNDTSYEYVVSASGPGNRQSPDSHAISAMPFRWVRILHYKSVGKDDTGTASASAENPPHESAARAFDGSLSSKWLMPTSTGWLQYRFAPGQRWAVTRYRLVSGQDAPGTRSRRPGPSRARPMVTTLGGARPPDAPGLQPAATRSRPTPSPTPPPISAYRLNISKQPGEQWPDPACRAGAVGR